MTNARDTGEQAGTRKGAFLIMKKEYPDIGEVSFVRSRRARRYSISISQSLAVRVTVPWLGTYRRAEALLIDNRNLILSRIEKMRSKVALNSAPDVAGMTEEQIAGYVERLRLLAKAELPQLVKDYASALGLAYNKVYIKHNRSNWGSCSTRGNINLNLNLMRVPEDLRSYVVLHELSHLLYMNHGPEFHACLDNACKMLISNSSDERELARRLKSYRLI